MNMWTDGLLEDTVYNEFSHENFVNKNYNTKETFWLTYVAIDDSSTDYVNVHFPSSAWNPLINQRIK